jgi:hypothetical protein
MKLENLDRAKKILDDLTQIKYFKKEAKKNELKDSICVNDAETSVALNSEIVHDFIKDLNETIQLVCDKHIKKIESELETL